MEGSNEARDISINALRPKTKALISDLLNPQTIIPAPNGVQRDWHGLAGLCKIDSKYEACLVNDPDRTSKVISLWQTKDPEGSTIKQFLLFLEEMDRFDVIADIEELIDEDIRIYRSNPEGPVIKPVCLQADKYIITTDDVKSINDGRSLENYDAFLLYDQDDIDFATQVLETMEKDYNMRFCCKDRDLVGGGLEMDKMITLITERCNRVVVILSDNFFKSSVDDYLVRFAQAFGIDKERKIVPIVYKDLTTQPAHIKYLFTLNYKRMAHFNFWDRLRDSIRVGDPEKMKISRSKSDNGQSLRSAIDESKDSCKLKPLHQTVKFSSSVGNLNSLEVISEPPLNPSTSADNLGKISDKKEKKPSWFKTFKEHLKKEKNDCTKQESKKGKHFFRKHMKRAAAVAN